MIYLSNVIKEDKRKSQRKTNSITWLYYSVSSSVSILQNSDSITYLYQLRHLSVETLGSLFGHYLRGKLLKSRLCLLTSRRGCILNQWNYFIIFNCFKYFLWCYFTCSFGNASIHKHRKGGALENGQCFTEDIYFHMCINKNMNNLETLYYIIIVLIESLNH